MAQPYENSPIEGAVELLKTNGFDALAEAVTVLLLSLIHISEPTRLQV